MPVHDKESQNIIHPWIFMTLTKQLPFKGPEERLLRRELAFRLMDNIKVVFMRAAILHVPCQWTAACVNGKWLHFYSTFQP